ncbi:MAG: DUF4315 family protein [Oscillospiraceae bacterium]|nr:DUF4315 family protein [Oscillospiraceae bacterium]
MNPRIAKIKDEMAKLREKVSKGQARLRELEKQLVDLENADIIAAFRGVEVAPEELAAFVQMFKDKQKSGTVPNLDLPTETPTRGAATPQTENDKEDSD